MSCSRNNTDTDDINGACISGRRAADGSGWCWYCNTRHARVETKRTPCCGDCWYDTAPLVRVSL